MEAHVEQLCAEHGIDLTGSSARGRAIRWRGGRLEIAIPRIKGQVSYYIALHEIGHLVGRGRSAPRLEAEANAWLWALEHSAVEPTEATLRSISNRLLGYLELGPEPPAPPRAAADPGAGPSLLVAADARAAPSRLGGAQQLFARGSRRLSRFAASRRLPPGPQLILRSSSPSRAPMWSIPPLPFIASVPA